MCAPCGRGATANARLYFGVSVSQATASPVTQQMEHWQKDTDLTGIRDKAALAKLLAEERVAWETLWADVSALLKKAQTPTQKEGK